MTTNESTARSAETATTHTASTGAQHCSPAQERLTPGQPGLSATPQPVPVTEVSPRPLDDAGISARWQGKGKTAVLSGVGVLALGLVCFSGYRWLQHTFAHVKTDNACVAAHIHQVSARITGTINEVLVDENQEVQAGAVLARIDPRDVEVKRAAAVAQLAQAQAKVLQAGAQTSQANAQVAQAQAHATKARQDLERATELYQGTSGAISKQEFENAQATADAAQANLRAAESAVESARASATAAQAEERVAQAALAEAELQLQYTSILAPASGRIGKKNLETGNRVLPGQPLLALVQPGVWVIANLKETQMADVIPGQPARIRFDAFPGRVFAGRVESLSPASGSQFALLPPDNATGNFTRVVQRVPVKIALEERSLGEFAARLAPGMSAVVEITVRPVSSLTVGTNLPTEPRNANVTY